MLCAKMASDSKENLICSDSESTASEIDMPTSSLIFTFWDGEL